MRVITLIGKKYDKEVFYLYTKDLLSRAFNDANGLMEKGWTVTIQITDVIDQEE